MKDLKILIAEDDEASELLISIALKEFGKEIIKVKTGIDAVEVCCDNHDIDLVLMDIKMPEMDGYEAIRQIRLFNPHVIIIAQTAYALSGDRENALLSGCDDYIVKPFSQSFLISSIETLFERNKQLCIENTQPN
jgi:CheY-like chemotaxis protein